MNAKTTTTEVQSPMTKWQRIAAHSSRPNRLHAHRSIKLRHAAHQS